MNKTDKMNLIIMIADQLKAEHELTHGEGFEITQFLKMLDFSKLREELKLSIKLNWNVEYINGYTFVNKKRQYRFAGYVVVETDSDGEYSGTQLTINQVVDLEYNDYLKYIGLWGIKKIVI